MIEKKTFTFFVTIFLGLILLMGGKAMAESNSTNGNNNNPKRQDPSHGYEDRHDCNGWNGNCTDLRSYNCYKVHAYDVLEFGKVVFSKRSNGSVYIDPRTEEKTPEGGAFDLGGHSSPATFEIQACPGIQFEVRLPNTVKMHPKRGGIEIRDMSVWPTGVLHIDPTGKQEFKVGGRMILPSGAKPGNYRAKFPVYINQNIE